MVQICSTGFKISSIDQIALNNDLLITPYQWARDALYGMINKAYKTLYRDWFSKFKTSQEESVPANKASIIAGIIALPDFKPYNYQTPALPEIDRKTEPEIEIWTGGFQIESFEKAALEAFYEDFEGMIRYFMQNKIFMCRQRMTEDWEKKLIADTSITSIPVKQDDLIALVSQRSDCKLRAARETKSAS